MAQPDKKSKSRTIRVPADLDKWIDGLPPDVLGPYYAQKCIAMLYKAKREIEETREAQELLRPKGKDESGEGESNGKSDEQPSAM